jgi:hypothetical protein
MSASGVRDSIAPRSTPRPNILVLDEAGLPWMVICGDSVKIRENAARRLKTSVFLPLREHESQQLLATVLPFRRRFGCHQYNSRSTPDVFLLHASLVRNPFAQRTIVAHISFQCSWDYKPRKQGKWSPHWIHFEHLSEPPKVCSPSAALCSFAYTRSCWSLVKALLIIS